MQWKSSQKSTAERVINLRREMSDLRNLLASRKKINAIMQSTARDAFSTKAILNEQASIDGLKAQILNIESQILVLNQEKMNEYLTFQNILSDVVDKELIFAEEPLYLYQVIPNESEEVTVGDNVLKVSTDQVGSPSLVPAFVDNTDKGSVAAGMSALVTPAGFNRTKFGGIKGQVVLSLCASRIDGMEARVGIKSIARSIEARMVAPTLLILKLEQSKNKEVVNSGGYR